ncbi:MBL fold metallo-hydrolase [Alkalibacter mobilis]|uniref:MBL fold metallo-hydrolase n=1 Tax=Alkalibacter mobilis TaxID=2787712 RepID=UPI00189DFC5D|nr:MBL fold metallo-hydrolase [Alkalibacter mobilis]MBF7097445.1 MBL fold metallo-hydrolase [Alkalibacter mobilis]
MILKHFYVEKIAHSSYILAGNETCAIIDPRRDIDIYIEESLKMGLKITHILETHLHADFISGHIELAQKTGAKIYMPKSAEADFEHVALSEEDEFFIEDMKISVLETPGHTPEHISYVVIDTATGDDPIGIFTGDTLFVGDAGRPDLFPDRALELAEKLYNSLHEKIMKLPDFCEVYPAHGAGSLCGKSMGAKYTTTIGYERKFNPVLQEKNIENFVKMLTEDMPAAPDHFARSSKINAQGPKPISELPVMRLMSPIEFDESRMNEDTIVVDTRSYFAFGGLHVPNAYCLDNTGNLPTFAGWVLPPEKNILLVAENLSKAKEAVTWLQRVGLDNTIGYLDGGMHAWATSGLPFESVRQISPREYEDLKHDENLTVVDARDRLAYLEQHIEGALNIPAPDLRSRHIELDKQNTILVICNSGVRSSLGISILKQNGFENILNFAGSMKGYLAYKES